MHLCIITFIYLFHRECFAHTVYESFYHIIGIFLHLNNTSYWKFLLLHFIFRITSVIHIIQRSSERYINTFENILWCEKIFKLYRKIFLQRLMLIKQDTEP